MLTTLKTTLAIACLLAFNLIASAQCDTLLMNTSLYSVSSTSSANGANPGSYAIDGNINTFWQSDAGSYPHEIVIDLGQSKSVTGFSYRPEQVNSNNGKLRDFEVYVTTTTQYWGSPERRNTITYSSNNDNGKKYVYFGAVPGQYFKLVALGGGGNEVKVSEIEVFYNTCTISGRDNQVVDLTDIPEQTTDNGGVELDATSSSGLAVQYFIASGPGIIRNDSVIFTGAGGNIQVAAYQPGTTSYYPSDTIYKTFRVIDLDSYIPQLVFKVNDSYDIEMPVLRPYPISAHATIGESNYLEITGVTMNITGENFDTLFVDGISTAALWTPPAYGSYTFTATATGSNGRDTTISKTVDIVQTATDKTVLTFDNTIISFGATNRTMYKTVDLPQFVGAYDSLHAYLDITCPPGGCDPYDRGGWIEARDRSGNWVQIIRYITPFGIACSHNVDLTPYLDLLQGTTELRFYIDTWAGGWEATLNLEYFEGTRTYPYSRLTEIWDGSFPFGNPANLQPVDTVTWKPEAHGEYAEFLLSNTGHGWGSNNSGNAAEFYHAYHTVNVGDSNYTQDLWYLCNPNPDGCNNQLGTWEYNRAGWCPGAISPPEVYTIGNLIGVDSLVFQYIFQESYVDECHAQNPNCVSGVTCADCNDGFNPIYYVDGQVVEYSNQPFIPEQPPVTAIQEPELTDIAFTLYPNPTSGAFYLNTQASLTGAITVLVQGINGQSVGTYYFEDVNQLNGFAFPTSKLSSGMYFVNIFSGDNVYNQKLVVE